MSAKTFRHAIEINPDYYFAHLGLTLSTGILGNREEAKASAAELLKIRPDFSVKEFESILPYDNQSKLDLVRESLRKAGLPE